MTLNLVVPWLLHAVALVVYSVLGLMLLTRRHWQNSLQLRFALYIGLALLSSLAFVASFGNWAFEEIRAGILRFHLYTLAALPLFYFATARAYIHLEWRPLSYVFGVVLLLALVAVDVFQLRFLIVNAIVEPDALIIGLRLLLWLIPSVYVLIIGSREYLRLHSPLHRNRLTYLALASIFLYADGVLSLLGGITNYQWAIILQLIGMTVLAYAAFRHSLVDLRMLLRQSLYYFIITAFAVLVYFFAIEAASSIVRGEDPSRSLISAVATALVLTFIYQPLHNLVKQFVGNLLFGENYDLPAVVSKFSQQLSARIELDELALEGRNLLRRAMGAREVHLLVFEQTVQGYRVKPVPQSEQLAPFDLTMNSSIIQTLTTRDVPLLQFDIDRLPTYDDLTPETRAHLQKLNGEVYLPIKRNESLIGAWVVGAKKSGDPYLDRDLTLLMTLAGQSAVALENARLLADLRYQITEMRSMRDYLDSTLASIATGVLTLNHENKIISINRAAEGIFRIPASRAIGRVYSAVLPEMEGVQLGLLIARLWSKSAQYLVRDVVTQVVGRGQVHLTLHLSTMRHADKMVGIAIVVEDLTEQARLEKERRAEEQEKQRIRDTFEHYVAPAVVDGLLADPRRVQLGGERQLVTILFADIHGFSNLSEQLAPEELVDVLNGYLAAAYRAILQFEGTVDKYMGDGMMAIFNAPLPQPDHAARAASAALLLHQEIEKFAQQMPRSQRLNFRVGLHTGEAIVGNIGTRDLMNYTAVGDTVNVAKRLQENAQPGQTLMSRSTFALIEEQALVTKSEVITIRGRSAPVEVFELSDLRMPA